MLSIKHIASTTLSMLLPISTSTLIYIMGMACAIAENNVQLRQEPILPIPLNIDTNTQKAKLGETLFFDTRLSSNNRISCASCHIFTAGGADNLVTGISISTEQNIINTPSIFNARYNFRQNWNGQAKTLGQQIDLAIKSEHEFNNTWLKILPELRKDNHLNNRFNNVYKDGITRKNVIDAIVEFEKTLITPNSRFDRYLRKEDIKLTKDEINGYIAFKELGCISCHQGINVGGNLFQKFGVFYNYIAERGNIKKPDYGRMNVTNRKIDAFVFKVPSLRNVAVTAPYLHDGSAKTIEDAIRIMGKTQLGRILTDNETRLIKLFLNTLTGEYKNKSLDVESLSVKSLDTES